MQCPHLCVLWCKLERWTVRECYSWRTPASAETCCYGHLHSPPWRKVEEKRTCHATGETTRETHNSHLNGKNSERQNQATVYTRSCLWGHTFIIMTPQHIDFWVMRQEYCTLVSELLSITYTACFSFLCLSPSYVLPSHNFALKDGQSYITWLKISPFSMLQAVFSVQTQGRLLEKKGVRSGS